MPSVRTTISSGGMSYDHSNFTTQFEAEQVGHESWLVTGPPSGTNAEWTRMNTRESPAMAQQVLGMSRPASPEVEQQAAEPEPEPEPHMTLKVHGFVRAEYEIVFPRRLDLTFQHWLGATVRASDHVEFQILQVRAQPIHPYHTQLFHSVPSAAQRTHLCPSDIRPADADREFLVVIFSTGGNHGHDASVCHQYARLCRSIKRHYGELILDEQGILGRSMVLSLF